MILNRTVITILFVLFGLYEIAHGYRQSKLYNLRFLFIGGILTGLPFIAAGFIFILGKVQSLGNWLYFIGASWLFGMLWETWQRRKYYRENSGDQ